MLYMTGFCVNSSKYKRAGDNEMMVLDGFRLHKHQSEYDLYILKYFYFELHLLFLVIKFLWFCDTNILWTWGPFH